MPTELLEQTIFARLLTPATEGKVRDDVRKLAGARLTSGLANSATAASKAAPTRMQRASGQGRGE